MEKNKRYIVLGLSFLILSLVLFVETAAEDIDVDNVIEEAQKNAQISENTHDCSDYKDNDGDGSCDHEKTCERHNSLGGCGKHGVIDETPEYVLSQTTSQTQSKGCGGCPKAQANGGSYGGH